MIIPSPTEIVASLDKLKVTSEEGCKIKPEIRKLAMNEERSAWIVRYSDGTYFWFKCFPGERVSFSLNPAGFESYGEMMAFILKHVDGSPNDAKLNRCDCAITFPKPLHEMNCAIDFGRRRKWSRFLDGGRFTGLYVGFHCKDRHKFTLYDKSKQARLPFPCTRLEVDDHPPGMTLERLPEIQTHTPFAAISHIALKLQEPVNPAPPEMARYLYFQSLLKQHGFWAARRQLNQETNRNFARVYGKFFTLERVIPGLDEIFQRGIKTYFS